MRLYHRPVGHPPSLPVSEILFKDLFLPVNQRMFREKENMLHLGILPNKMAV